MRFRRACAAALAVAIVSLPGISACDSPIEPEADRTLTATSDLEVSTAVSPVSSVTTTDWEEFENNPVFSPGRAYYPSVIQENGQFKMWYSGTSVGGFGIEMTTSSDGINWGSPQDASTGLASFSHHSHVEKIEGEYRIWYWDCCQRNDISVLRTATSTDGTNWSNDQPLQQVEGDVITGEPGSVFNRFGLGLEEVLYNPDGADQIVEPNDVNSVFQNKYIGYFGNSNGGQQFVGLAVSADGITWEAYKDGANPIFGPAGSGNWDATHVYPGTVLKDASGTFHMWYSGGDGDVSDGIGHATSPNGVTNWTRSSGNPIFHMSDGESWRTKETYTVAVLEDKMWFSGENGDQAIGLALPARIEVELDIKPGDDPNAINPKSRGNVPVAILHTDDFDPVARTNVSSLRFGDPDDVSGGGAQPAHGGHAEDVDGDGDDDLVLHFPTEDTGFEGEEDTGKLVGETNDGTPLFGTDSVKLVGGGPGGGS